MSRTRPGGLEYAFLLAESGVVLNGVRAGEEVSGDTKDGIAPSTVFSEAGVIGGGVFGRHEGMLPAYLVLSLG